MTLPDISEPDIQFHDVEVLCLSLSRMMKFVSAITAVPFPGELHEIKFAPIITKAETAKSHAQYFEDHIFDETVRCISQLVLHFNVQLENTCSTCQVNYKHASRQPLFPVSVFRKQTDTILNELINCIALQHEKAVTANRQLKSFSAFLNDDLAFILSITGNIGASAMAKDKTVGLFTPLIQEMRAGEQVPGSAPVTPHGKMMFGQYGDVVLAFSTYIKLLFQGLADELSAALQQMQAVSEKWMIILRKYSGVITALDNAAEDDYVAIYSQIQFAASRSNWQALASRTLPLATAFD